ncbi:hypothetical protein PV327_002942 [Microctonus hyperodae]|uniref:Uncharacterized protein n=1 Tax=Microctonus hyperodae TaxID=165561 RepID=A0AA39G3T8_MICHY|nr:hypothetical protein PV327_002942 [Microctonus hyperodae]
MNSSKSTIDKYFQFGFYSTKPAHKRIEFEITGNKENISDDNVRSSILNRYDEARAISPKLGAPRQLENRERNEKRKVGDNVNKNDLVLDPAYGLNSGNYLLNEKGNNLTNRVNLGNSQNSSSQSVVSINRNELQPAYMKVKAVYESPNGRIFEEEKIISFEDFQKRLSVPSFDDRRAHFAQENLISARSGQRDNFINRQIPEIINAQRHSPNHRRERSVRSERSGRGSLAWHSSSSSDSENGWRGNRHSSYYSSYNRRGRPFRNSPQRDYGPSGREEFSENERRYSSRRQVNEQLTISSGINIGRIVNTWNLSFPKSESDPEQLLLLLEENLQTYSINKDLFVPCLSSIFTGDL